MLALVGGALVALVAVTLLKGQKSEFAAFVSLGASILLLAAAWGILTPILDEIRLELDASGFGEYVAPIFKALGITLAVQLASELCRDSGESALASRLELIGRAELLLLALPLLRELLTLARGLLA